jgi:hypothetical protein
MKGAGSNPHGHNAKINAALAAEGTEVPARDFPQELKPRSLVLPLMYGLKPVPFKKRQLLNGIP